MKLMMWVLLGLAVGCKSNDNSLSLLRAHEWQLKSMTENDTVVTNPRQLPTLLFTDSSAVYGSAGCNRFFGKYTAEANGNMNLQPGGATMMYCPDMNFEDRYIKALTQISNFAVMDRELKLKSANGKLHLVYVPVDTTQRIGMAEDAHGCNAAAGYTWSELRGDCIRLFEEGVQLTAVAGQDTTLAAYVVFATDSLNAEVFLPDQEKHPVLERRRLPQGGYVWNQEDDDTLTVRRVNGQWVIEQRQQVLYSGVE